MIQRDMARRSKQFYRDRFGRKYFYGCDVERNRRDGKYEVFIHREDGSKIILATYDTYSEAHEHKYGVGKKALQLNEQTPGELIVPDTLYKEIRVGSGLNDLGRRIALVDEEDYENLYWREWDLRRSKSGNFYALTSVDGKGISMHRLIMGVSDPAIVIDHIDGFGLNNRRYNLRPTTHRGNMRNLRRWKVEFNRKTRKHEVIVSDPNGSRRVIGAFDSYSAAHQERYEKELYWKDWE